MFTASVKGVEGVTTVCFQSKSNPLIKFMPLPCFKRKNTADLWALTAAGTRSWLCSFCPELIFKHLGRLICQILIIGKAVHVLIF